MKVYGASVIKGLLYTLKTFVETYVEDFKRMGGKEDKFSDHGLRSQEEGIVTVMFPEAPMPIGSTYERFRVLPMLIYDKLTPEQKPSAPTQTRVAQEHPDKEIRCTACGICAKVCPPQCIWIVQESDDKGKPITNPKDFYIDTSVCMNCGMCAEFCPFDAIKMDHQFALNVTEKRQENYLYDLERLLVPAEYYAELHPKANAAEEATRKAEAEAKAAKEAAKKEAAAKKAAEAAAAGAEGEVPAKEVDPEKAAKIAAAKAKAAAAKAAKEAGGEAPAKEVDPEREAKIAAAKAKAAEAKAKKEAEKAAEAGSAGESAPEEKPAKPAKAADPEREAKIAAAKAKAAEAKAAKEAAKKAEEAQQSAISEVKSETATETSEDAGQSKQEQTTEKESEPMTMTDAKASIQAGADESHAIAQNDPVFTNPATANEVGQAPPKSKPSESNLAPDSPTAGDEAAQNPPEVIPQLDTASEETIPLASGALAAPAGDEHAAASAQPAAPDQANDQANSKPPKASHET